MESQSSLKCVSGVVSPHAAMSHSDTPPAWSMTKLNVVLNVLIVSDIPADVLCSHVLSSVACEQEYFTFAHGSGPPANELGEPG